MSTLQAEPEKLRASIAALEAQRAMLGDAVVDTALASLREKLAALQARTAQATAAAERRFITILFSDVMGSVTLAEKLDPEEWRDAISQVQSTIGRIVTQRGGMIAQYQGDALIAFFGARMVSESDPENAVRAGLAAQSAVAQLKAGGTLTLPSPLEIRVGIHTGLVVLGEWGADARIEFGAFGDAVNVAARLQTAAPPGGVLISEDTYRNVRGIFDVTPQPLITLKGKSQPTQTYVVRRAKPRPFRTVTRGVMGVEARTVGREMELSRLQTALASAVDQSKLVWAQLVGEPGVGKSRILGEMMAFLDSRPELLGLLKARAFQGDEQQAFGLVRRAWFDLFQIAEDAPLAEAQAKWQDRFLDLRGPGFEEAAHSLGLLAGLPFADSPYIGAMRNDPAQVKGRALVVSRELLGAIRARTHVVILLEDLHWVDASSWDYLVQVILEGAPARHGLFVLGTARPEWNPPEALLKNSDYVQLDLAPLSDAACRELTLDLLRPVEGVPDDVTQMIVQRSEGMPYFAEEMVNWFLDRGIIDASHEPWRFDPARLQESPLPTTLQHLLFTRLGSLPETERVALQRGSIFGRHFWEGGLEALGVPSSGECLRQLQPRNLVHLQPESSLAGETEWFFHHNLLQEVTYETILKRDRKRQHQAAGAWLEQQARRAGRLDEFVGLLGQHAERAGDMSTAAEWYLRAGERAKARGALLEARQLFDRALELVPGTERLQRWRAMLGRTEITSRVDERGEHRANVAALREMAGGLNDSHRAQALFHEGLCADHMGDYRAALQSYDAALDAAWRASDHRLGAMLLGSKVICQGRLGDVNGAAATAELVLSRAYEVDEATGAKVLSSLAVYYVESGNLAKAAKLHDEQAVLNHQLGDRNAEATALSNLGYDYVCLGRPEAGRAALEQSLRLYQSTGARRELVYGRLNLGLAYWRSGDSRAACQVLEQLQPELAAMGDAFAQAAGLSYLALALEQSGHASDAGQNFSQARELFSAIGVHGFATDARAGQARIALALGRTDEAREHAEAVCEYLRGHGAQGMELPVRAYLTCTEVFEALGESARSRAAIEEGYHELMQRADRISDLEWRSSFAENVPEHRAIRDKRKQLAGLRA